MNWYHFLFYLSIGYGIYYSLNILYDIFISRKSSAKIEQCHEIIFPQKVTPQKVSLNMPINDSSNKNIVKSPDENYGHVMPSAPHQGNGGVNMLELVALMQQHVIQYTNAIPY